MDDPQMYLYILFSSQNSQNVFAVLSLVLGDHLDLKLSKYHFWVLKHVIGCHSVPNETQHAMGLDMASCFRYHLKSWRVYSTWQQGLHVFYGVSSLCSPTLMSLSVRSTRSPSHIHPHPLCLLQYNLRLEGQHIPSNRGGEDEDGDLKRRRRRQATTLPLGFYLVNN